MKSIKFIHTCDIHVGMSSYGRINPETKLNTRLEDLMRSLDFLVETALREPVDIVLIAGDVFDRNRPTPEEEYQFAMRIRRLAGAGIKVVIETGNHDATLTGDKTCAVDVYDALNIRDVEVARRPEIHEFSSLHGLQVVCLPWVGSSNLVAKEEFKALTVAERKAEIEKRLVSLIRKLTDRVDTTRPAILMGHFPVVGSTLSGTEYASLSGDEPHVPLSALADIAYQYVALGHIHQFQDLNDSGRPPVVYAGSLECKNFSEEGQRKGFVLGEIREGDDGWECSYKFIEGPARRFITVDLGVDGMPAELPGDEIEGAVVRLRMEITAADQDCDEAELKRMYARAFAIKFEKKYAYKDNKRPVRAEGFKMGLSPASALELYFQQRPELEPLRKDMEACVGRITGEREAA